MPDARQFGRGIGRAIRRKAGRVSAVVIVVMITIISLVVIEAGRGRLTLSEPKPKPKDSTKVEEDRRQAAEHERVEAERLQDEERQREIKRQQAIEQAEEAVRQETRRAVKVCVSIVREQSDARLYKGLSRFDAYVSGQSFHYFGTAEERFQFEKCMAEHGHALSTRSEDIKK